MPNVPDDTALRKAAGDALYVATGDTLMAVLPAESSTREQHIRAAATYLQFAALKPDDSVK